MKLDSALSCWGDLVLGEPGQEHSSDRQWAEVSAPRASVLGRRATEAGSAVPGSALEFLALVRAPENRALVWMVLALKASVVPASALVARVRALAQEVPPASTLALAVLMWGSELA